MQAELYFLEHKIKSFLATISHKNIYELLKKQNFLDKREDCKHKKAHASFMFREMAT